MGFTITGLVLLQMSGTGMCAETVFVGKVAGVDRASQVLSIKTVGAVVNFDVSTVVLTGYRSIEDIRRGDTVGVVYTSSGVKVVKSSGGTALARSLDVETRRTTKVSGKLQRRKPRGNKLGFEDGDINRDGKISPVELSVVIPDITMTRFREYDSDCNGYLGRAELLRAVAKDRASQGQTEPAGAGLPD